MNKKDLMLRFIRIIRNRKLLTDFIKNIFDYDDFNDYNYLFRVQSEDDRVIIDIYDNISENRFNRYNFIFSNGDFDVQVFRKDNVFNTYMYIVNLTDSNNKLLKFGYLFKLDEEEMVEYAKTFLDIKFVMVLDNLLHKFISQS